MKYINICSSQYLIILQICRKCKIIRFLFRKCKCNMFHGVKKLKVQLQKYYFLGTSLISIADIAASLYHICWP